MSDDPAHCSIAPPSELLLLSDRPTVNDLLELLDTLDNWKLFLKCLPGVTPYFIESCSDKKERAFVQWLNSHHTASWRHVLIALIKAEEELFLKVLNTLTRRMSFQIKYVHIIP